MARGHEKIEECNIHLCKTKAKEHKQYLLGEQRQNLINKVLNVKTGSEYGFLISKFDTFNPLHRQHTFCTKFPENFWDLHHTITSVTIKFSLCWSSWPRVNST